MPEEMTKHDTHLHFALRSVDGDTGDFVAQLELCVFSMETRDNDDSKAVYIGVDGGGHRTRVTIEDISGEN